MALCLLHLVLSIKGVPARTALIQRHTQRPHVTLLVIGLVLTHFG